MVCFGGHFSREYGGKDVYGGWDSEEAIWQGMGFLGRANSVQTVSADILSSGLRGLVSIISSYSRE